MRATGHGGVSEKAKITKTRWDGRVRVCVSPPCLPCPPAIIVRRVLAIWRGLFCPPPGPGHPRTRAPLIPCPPCCRKFLESTRSSDRTTGGSTGSPSTCCRNPHAGGRRDPDDHPDHEHRQRRRGTPAQTVAPWDLTASMNFFNRFLFCYRIVHRPTMPGCGAKGLALAFVSGTCELRGQPSRPPPPPPMAL